MIAPSPPRPSLRGERGEKSLGQGKEKFQGKEETSSVFSLSLSLPTLSRPTSSSSRRRRHRRRRRRCRPSSPSLGLLLLLLQNHLLRQRLAQLGHHPAHEGTKPGGLERGGDGVVPFEREEHAPAAELRRGKSLGELVGGAEALDGERAGEGGFAEALEALELFLRRG